MTGRLLPVFVAALAVLGGCGAVDTALREGTRSPDATPEWQDTTAVPPGTLVPDTGSRRGVVVDVVEVVDGDTLDVRYPNGTTDTVRLLGIDTPEVHSSTDPTEFEGVPDSAAGRRCLRTRADDATVAVTARLDDQKVRLITDAASDRRDRYDRLLAYVVHDDRNVNYWLVARGHARVYDTEFRYADAFYAAEQRAQDRALGVWQCRDPGGTPATTRSGERVPLSVADVHADAAGNDHENLNDEYVVFRNTGEEPLELSGWTLTDSAGHVFAFPADTVLGPGTRLTVHTGAGADGGGHYYWNSDTAVWNNDGDTVAVYDDEGVLVLSTTYGG